MYYKFTYYAEVESYLKRHATAKLVAWPYQYGKGCYIIFVPLEVQKR